MNRYRHESKLVFVPHEASKFHDEVDTIDLSINFQQKFVLVLNDELHYCTYTSIYMHFNFDIKALLSCNVPTHYTPNGLQLDYSMK